MKKATYRLIPSTLGSLRVIIFPTQRKDKLGFSIFPYRDELHRYGSLAWKKNEACRYLIINKKQAQAHLHLNRYQMDKVIDKFAKPDYVVGKGW